MGPEAGVRSMASGCLAPAKFSQLGDLRGTTLQGGDTSGLSRPGKPRSWHASSVRHGGGTCAAVSMVGQRATTLERVQQGPRNCGRGGHSQGRRARRRHCGRLPNSPRPLGSGYRVWLGRRRAGGQGMRPHPALSSGRLRLSKRGRYKSFVQASSCKDKLGVPGPRSRRVARASLESCGMQSMRTTPATYLVSPTWARLAQKEMVTPRPEAGAYWQSRGRLRPQVRHWRPPTPCVPRLHAQMRSTQMRFARLRPRPIDPDLRHRTTLPACGRPMGCIRRARTSRALPASCWSLGHGVAASDEARRNRGTTRGLHEAGPAARGPDGAVAPGA